MDGRGIKDGTKVPSEPDLERFAADLEDLCRRSGLWLRADGPFGMIVYPAYGEEGPFAVSRSPDGTARIARTLLPDGGGRDAGRGRKEGD